MKHSIRYIEVTYTKRGGHSILVLRGMYVRQWAYSQKNMSRILLSTRDPLEWKTDASHPNKITFARIYPQD
jgi:hypothetical protein